MTPFLKTTNDFTPMMSCLAITAGAGQIVAPGPDPLAPTRAIMLTTAGSVSLTMADDTAFTATFPATATGVMLYLSVKKVTAGTGVIGFW